MNIGKKVNIKLPKPLVQFLYIMDPDYTGGIYMYINAIDLIIISKSN